ncbi:hypothetical protein SESBI_08577 [Sesbania bispinosa]|nr:hypothetical protein SESBI_08577 [Sesbania bispinosa]
MALASAIQKPIRVYEKTLEVNIGRFARACVGNLFEFASYRKSRKFAQRLTMGVRCIKGNRESHKSTELTQKLISKCQIIRRMLAIQLMI